MLVLATRPEVCSPVDGLKSASTAGQRRRLAAAYGHFVRSVPAVRFEGTGDESSSRIHRESGNAEGWESALAEASPCRLESARQRLDKRHSAHAPTAPRGAPCAGLTSAFACDDDNIGPL